MFEFEANQIYTNLDTIIDTKRLKEIYNEIIGECWADMEPMLKERAYIHCYLYYTKPNWTPDRILSKWQIRDMYNAIRGWNDESDINEYLGKWCKTWTYKTGWMLYFYAGPENCRSGDANSFQNIYKFIPNQKTIKKYQTEIDLYKNQVKDFTGYDLIQLMFTLLPVGSGVDWHVDTNLVGRFHSVIENDGKTPSMTFKQDGQLKDIPAVPGETYYANINVPHCVPLSKSPRLHLLGCVSDIDADKKGKDVTRHQAMGDSGITWADWKKDLGV